MRDLREAADKSLLTDAASEPSIRGAAPRSAGHVRIELAWLRTARARDRGHLGLAGERQEQVWE